MVIFKADILKIFVSVFFKTAFIDDYEVTIPIF